ncbi:MAG: hypothetical protein R3300_00475 [Candidatus Promineifilaceae bacterium]|nr:hypothetical protein [Candidatus Promineifilaceae bacterium]
MTHPPTAARVDLLAHADWSKRPGKRWLARAVRTADGRYLAHAPEPVAEAATLLDRLRAAAGPRGRVLVGFDFPLGLPLAYARRVGIDEFIAALPRLGQGSWHTFYQVAERPDQISVRRPFYPQRPGGTLRQHLLEGLGLREWADLLRYCERARPGRRAAAPLFYTMGAQQVGKAAISGWQEVLAPALQKGVLLWPFQGSLFELLRPGLTVVAETYPAEVYEWLGIAFRPGKVGKGDRTARRQRAAALFRWAERRSVQLSPALAEAIHAGFPADRGRDDGFDAAVGLFGLLEVILGYRPAGEPADADIRAIEGWILGRDPDGVSPA